MSFFNNGSQKITEELLKCPSYKGPGYCPEIQGPTIVGLIAAVAAPQPDEVIQVMEKRRTLEECGSGAGKMGK